MLERSRAIAASIGSSKRAATWEGVARTTASKVSVVPPVSRRLQPPSAVRLICSTVAFNRSLCEKARLAPLEFDGRTDSLYHPFDLEGRRHMEYLSDYGPAHDVPYDAILARFAELYPGMRTMIEAQQSTTEGDFEAEIEAESAERERKTG